ncbi:MAG TPA: hypothetical protein VHC48_24230, partial [Puia sp.]|nr:hypothetical protein [Puia sp.]
LWEKKYQRRTQKGTGRTEKTEPRAAAKNPRLLKACNITSECDMGEFFFISEQMKLCKMIFYDAKMGHFLVYSHYFNVIF